MALDNQKLYYLKTPARNGAYIIQEVLPVVERTLGEDFSGLREVLYLEFNGSGKYSIVPIRTSPPRTVFENQMRIKHESEDRQVLALAAYICLYMHTHERDLKVIALRYSLKSTEELLLKKAVQFINKECQDVSPEPLKKIVLEELIAKP